MTPTTSIYLIALSPIAVLSILSVLYIIRFSKQDSLCKMASITGFVAVLTLAGSTMGALSRSGDDPQDITLFAGLVAVTLFVLVSGGFLHFEISERKRKNDSSIDSLSTQVSKNNNGYTPSTNTTSDLHSPDLGCGGDSADCSGGDGGGD